MEFSPATAGKLHSVHSSHEEPQGLQAHSHNTLPPQLLQFLLNTPDRGDVARRSPEAATNIAAIIIIIIIIGFPSSGASAFFEPGKTSSTDVSVWKVFQSSTWANPTSSCCWLFTWMANLFQSYPTARPSYRQEVGCCLDPLMSNPPCSF